MKYVAPTEMAGLFRCVGLPTINQFDRYFEMSTGI